MAYADSTALPVVFPKGIQNASEESIWNLGAADRGLTPLCRSKILPEDAVNRYCASRS
jgi:hypothetical protein